MGTSRYPLAPLLAAARVQGWAIEIVDPHTVKVSHPEAGIHVVDDTKSGEHTRRALREAIGSYEAQSKSYEIQDGHR